MLKKKYIWFKRGRKLYDNFMFFEMKEIESLNRIPEGSTYKEVYLKLCILLLCDKGIIKGRARVDYDIETLSHLFDIDLEAINSALEWMVHNKILDYNEYPCFCQDCGRYKNFQDLVLSTGGFRVNRCIECKNNEENAKQKGLVYFIRADDKIKIGHVRSDSFEAIESRLNQIKTGISTEDFEIVYYEPGGEIRERELHKQFKKHRIGRREWFNFDDEIKNYILSKKQEGAIK